MRARAQEFFAWLEAHGETLEEAEAWLSAWSK
jgi:hypothetical protein